MLYIYFCFVFEIIILCCHITNYHYYHNIEIKLCRLDS